MRYLLIGGIGLLILAACSSEDDGADGTDVQTSAAAATSASAGEPTDEPEPTPAPTPSATPAPTIAPPVDLQGAGMSVTDTITPPAAISIVTLTHSGESNFIVTAFIGGDEQLLANKIGPYSGSRPLFGQEPVFFEVNADGAWTIHIESIGVAAGTTSFSGQGDAVSGLMFAELAGQDTDPAPWTVSHDGSRNFIVWLRCADGDELVQNVIGAVTGETVVAFGEDPCLWEVQADGNWSLAPRS